MKTLIVYGTRFGATASVSQEIERILREDGFDVKVVDLKEDRIDDISEYEVIIVGSGIKMGRWKKEPERFLQNHGDELSNKKLALFVCSGTWPFFMKQGRSEEAEKVYQKCLGDIVEKFSLKPISMSIFGGTWDYNKMGWMARRALGALKSELEKAGFQEKDGVYDMRDWESIRNWTKELIQKIRE